MNFSHNHIPSATKRIIAACSAAFLLIGISGCGSTADSETAAYTVGICQYSAHTSLTQATEGFRAALTERLGGKVSFDERIANSSYEDCVQIMNDFISKDVDLILANATPALQAAGNATAQIPIIGTAVTDYSPFDAANISGTSDFVPAKEQALMIRELFPDAEKIGLIYCSSEASSLYQVNAMQDELTLLEYSCELYPFVDAGDLADVAETAAQNCTLLYLPTDNTIAGNAELIGNICIPSRIPIITGDENTCRICGIAALAVDFYAMGYASGEMAVQTLTGDADPKTLTVLSNDDYVYLYNKELCETLGVEVPDYFIPLE